MLNNKMKRLCCCILCIVIILSLTSCSKKKTSTPSVADAVQLKSALNTVKIMRNEDIASLEDASKSGLRFEGAKGETEGAQLILRTNKKLEYDVVLSDLVNESGQKISASAVTVYVEGYLYTSRGYTGFPSGEYPDAMIPIEYKKSAKENYTESDKNQGLWFDILIPDDANAGVYMGDYVVKAGDIEIKVPVSLEVYNFNMPTAPYIKSTYLIWQDWLMDGELDNTIDKYKDYYDELLEYNLTAYYFPVEIGDVEGFIECLRNYYDKVSSYGIPHENVSLKFEKDNIFGGEEGQKYNAINYELFEEYLVAIAKACKEDGKNYFDKMYYYLDKVYDEVTEERYPQMRACITKVNELEEKVAKEQALPTNMAESLKNAQHALTVVHGWTEEFNNYKELRVIPEYKNFGNTKNIEMYVDLIKQGYTIESYGVAGFWPYASQLVDQYLITSRDLYWSKFDYNLDGDLYWCVNGYCNWSAGNVVGYVRVPDLYTTSSRDSTSDGDGYYFYPGAPYGSKSPFPSLRLLAVRDGIDDYDYLSLLEEKSIALAKEYGVSADAVSDVIKTINEEIYATGTSKLNFEGLQSVRRSVARLIELADSDAGLVLTSFDTNEKGITYSFVTRNGVEVKLNGEVLTGSGKAVNGTIYSGTNIAYNESGIFELEACGIITELCVGKAPTVLVDITNAAQIKQLKVNTKYGSSVTLANQKLNGVNEAIANVTLSGYKFDDETSTKSFSPAIYFNVEDIDKTKTISFWVYNSGSEFEVNLTAGNEEGMSYPLDTVVLPANGWKHIEISNFNRISIEQSTLSNINEIRLSCMNLLDENSNPYKKTMYISSVYQQMK